MARNVIVGAAQFGPVHRTESRDQVVQRLIALLREGHARGCQLVVFTECALTAFFPHWYMTDIAEIDSYFETEMPNAVTKPLFAEAARLGVGFHLGYAELTWEQGQKRHYNTAILVDQRGEIVGKYRKIHLPGWSEPQPDQPFQNLEKYYFDVGNLGFRVWRAFDGIVGMCICNDRRWPETYRVLGLQGIELLVLGYNTPANYPPIPSNEHLANFHNLLCMQSGAYQNATWVVGVAKAGEEEGVKQIGQSCIIAPSGEIVAMATTLEDEVVTAQCDLDQATLYKKHLFHFAAHRRIEHYGLITQQTGVVLPPARATDM
ncbi:MAG: N-carbamoyl-D-amino-acid hydrolase [Caldilineaceae bacterium]|nr:N-carbamoyl-D-amino-acid hydrolase [Caldilineaceae bacterium]